MAASQAQIAGERGGGRAPTWQVTSLGSNKNEHVFSLLMVMPVMMMMMMMLYQHLLSFYRASRSSIRQGLIWFSQQMSKETITVRITQTRKLTVKGLK